MVTLGSLVTTVHIPARHGRAVHVKKGQRIKVIDVQGKQVCDFFAVDPKDPTVYLSGIHTRSSINHMRPQVGKPLYNNQRQPILMLEEDKAGNIDMLFAPCDPVRYLVDYGVKDHRSCKQNVTEALAEFGVHPPVTPEVVNIFQNSGPDDLEGNLSVKEPSSQAGDYVIMRALEDLLIAGSACPQDLNPCNGFNPSDLAIEIYE